MPESGRSPKAPSRTKRVQWSPPSWRFHHQPGTGQWPSFLVRQTFCWHQRHLGQLVWGVRRTNPLWHRRQDPSPGTHPSEDVCNKTVHQQKQRTKRFHFTHPRRPITGPPDPLHTPTELPSTSSGSVPAANPNPHCPYLPPHHCSGTHSFRRSPTHPRQMNTLDIACTHTPNS